MYTTYITVYVYINTYIYIIERYAYIYMIYAVPRRYSKVHSFAAPGARLHGQRGEHLVQEPRGVTRGHGASGHVSMDWKRKSKPETMGKPP